MFYKAAFNQIVEKNGQIRNLRNLTLLEMAVRKWGVKNGSDGVLSDGNLFTAKSYSFVNRYTAHVGTMTNSSSVTSTNAYDPKQSTSV